MSSINGSATTPNRLTMPGLATGIDTSAIVEQLMAIQRQGYDKTSEKVQAERLKLQAYQSVNSMMLSLKTSVNSLSSQNLWKAKQAVSSNDKALNATATSSAEEGSHSFRVGKLASSAKYLSKGFSSKDSSVINPGSSVQKGTITLESSKARVDNSAKLEDLNGGKGIYRGSIRITDARGTSSIVDLSVCETMEDIIREINGAAGTQVEATIEDGCKLKITDKTGVPGGLTIQNVGQGTTATDLGIAGSSNSGALVGEKAFFIGNDTSLSMLNDGLGIEEGMISITVGEKSTGRTCDIDVDLNGCRTVGDVLNAVNSTIKGLADGTIVDADGNPFANNDLVAGLRLEINADQNGLTFGGGKAGNFYTVTELKSGDLNGNVQMSDPHTAYQLGLLGTYEVSANGAKFAGTRLLGDVNSPMIKNLSGANKEGIGTDGSRPITSDPNFSGSTLLKNLNGGRGISIVNGTMTILYKENGTDNAIRTPMNLFDATAIRLLNSDDTATVDDLLNYMNQQLATHEEVGLRNLSFKVDSAAKGIYLDGIQGNNVYELEGGPGTLAYSLGLTGGYGGSSTNAALDALYAESDLSPGGVTHLGDNTTLADIYIGGTQIVQSPQIDDIVAAGSLTVTVGIAGVDHAIAVDLTGFDDTSKFNDILDHINSEIETAVKGIDPGTTVPRLRMSLYGSGVEWANVDPTQNFSVSGSAATTLGIDRNYTGQTMTLERSDVQLNLDPIMTGTSVPKDLAGTDLLSSLNGGRGLDFIGNSMTITFGGGGPSVTVTRDEILDELGNFGALTIDQYTTKLSALFNAKIAADPVNFSNGEQVAFGIDPDANKGITLTYVKGRTDGEYVTMSGDMFTGKASGIKGCTVTAKDNPADFVPQSGDNVADIRGVTSTPVNYAGLGNIEIEIGGATHTLSTASLDNDSTLNDLIKELNRQLDLIVPGGAMYFGASTSGTGLSFTNKTTDDVTFVYSDSEPLASDLGLVGKKDDKGDTTVAGNSYMNGTTLNRNYISRATSLATLNGGLGADKGTIVIQDAQGYTSPIDLSNCLTVGDVIDAINTLGPMSVRAGINKAGDGIIVYQVDDSPAFGTEPTRGQISITNADSTKTAEHLGIAGVGVGGDNEKEPGDGMSVIDGSMKVTIEIGPGDSLTDIMNRVGTAGTQYKASIINDGNADNPWRLSIDAARGGAGSDFIIDTNLDMLGLSKASSGQDSMLLYGQANATQSPTVLRSNTNTNNKAIIGLTLELTETTDSYVTVTVKSDTEKVVEEIQNMVQAYNDMSDLLSYLDAYDYENDQKGILNGDTSVRGLMESIDEMFYSVFNPDNISYAEMQNSTKKSAWTWDDLGIALSTNTVASDDNNPPRYQKMELDVDKLNEMVSTDWEQLFEVMAGQRNASSSKLAKGAAASAMFNFNRTDKDGNPLDDSDFWDPNNAINNDRTTGNWGKTNGFTANGTIEEGENEYTIFFQGNITLDRVSIYHPNSADAPAAKNALKDFTVEFLNANTGKWEVLRDFKDNTSSSSIIGVPPNTVAQAIRITASSTNAEDGKFRLLDVQCLESTGLAGKLNQKVNSLTDVVDGYFTNANRDVENKIKDLQDQMEKMAERLQGREEALWRKFSAMEAAMSQMKNQGDYLSSYFASVSSGK
jgi:Flagellar capping protein